MTVTARSHEAHRKTVTSDIELIARYLQETLGQKLVAYITGMKDPKAVGRWASGQNTPRPAAEERLRAAYQVFQELLAGDDPYTIRAWFIGMNPQLRDEPPAAAIREGQFREAMAAARTYLAGG